MKVQMPFDVTAGRLAILDIDALILLALGRLTS